jgi:hypothetical protein
MTDGEVMEAHSFGSGDKNHINIAPANDGNVFLITPGGVSEPFQRFGDVYIMETLN